MSDAENAEQARQWFEKIKAAQERVGAAREEFRRRLDFTLRTIFATAAGALALSIGALISERPPKLLEFEMTAIRYAFPMLFAVLLLVAVILAILVLAARADATFVELDAKEFRAGAASALRRGEKLRGTAYALSGVALLAFLVGIGLLGRIAVSIASRSTTSQGPAETTSEPGIGERPLSPEVPIRGEAR